MLVLAQAMIDQVGVSGCDGGAEEVVLGRGQAESGRRRPPLVVIEPAAGQEISPIAAGRLPLVDRNDE